MTQDDVVAPISPRPRAGRTLLFGGVAAACLAGAGLGLWARPVNGEQPAAAIKPPPEPVAAAPASDRRLQVVVDDAPAPVGKPMDVLPASPADPHARPAAPLAPEPQAAKRPPLGLLRVAAPLRIPTPPAAKPAEPAPAPARAVEAPEPLPVVPIKAKPAPRNPAETETPLRLAHTKHAKLKKAAASTKLAKAKKHPKARAQTEEALADAAPPPRAARPRRALLALAHAIERVAGRRPHVEEADRADPAPERPRKASVRETRPAKPAPKPKVERYVPPLNTKGAGPIKVASVTTRCASPDPGEALACGDPNLVAAQRRLNRAYQEAEAAGVPHATLEQQQQRWLAARAAAAREAPWAVREVYQARIAELQDLARDAEGN